MFKIDDKINYGFYKNVTIIGEDEKHFVLQTTSGSQKKIYKKLVNNNGSFVEIMIYEIMIRVDTNDADYDTKISSITKEELESIRPIIAAIKNFKPYKVNVKSIDWTHDHNWAYGELLREDLGEKKPEEIYSDLDFETDAMYLFKDLLPGGSEYGFHSIKNIEAYPRPEKEILL